MKKFYLSAMVIMLVFSLTACSNNTSEKTETVLQDSFTPPAVSEVSNKDMVEEEEVFGIIESKIPDNFNFNISFGFYGKNNINTYSNTFTKDLIEAGTEAIDFIIPPEKIREIYEAFLESKIYELPDDINAEVENIEGKEYTSWEPFDSYTLTYTYDNVTRTIVCEDGGPWYADSGPTDSRNRLVKFVGIITDYIYSTEVFQNMSSSVGGYQ